ncbi:hypothetical protein HanOQP8_Chr02g0071921 [Helianthus annuus]|nr:hypothetical protein HanOQP8_Chr02g0071921 [Helianthus annuus]
MYFWKKQGTKCVTKCKTANHRYRDHPCSFGKLGTKSKILVNHRDHLCTLLYLFSLFFTYFLLSFYLALFLATFLYLFFHRPLVGTPCPSISTGKNSSFSGNLVGKARFRNQREDDAVSTSHFSQPNTIEYDMAMEWRLLQLQSVKCWEKLHEVR